MTQTSFQTSIRTFSDRIVEAQRDIRILDAIAWDESIRVAFFDAGARKLPPVDHDYYRKRDLGFEPERVRFAFNDIARDIVSTLGRMNPAAAIMLRMVDDYLQVLEMLIARGTATFSELAQRFYGRSSDVFHHGGPSLADLGKILHESLVNINEAAFLEGDVKKFTAAESVDLLQRRLNTVFTNPEDRVRVVLSDGIVADAAAGADYIKLRADAMFSERDLRVLEVHEGWVHVGTTLNGKCQPHCTFLSKGTPTTTVTQEGLAVLIEVISFSSHPARLRNITDRIRGIQMAENGANFLDVYNLLVNEGRPSTAAYQSAMRVFRGSTPTGGPFTKDLSYSKGFVQVYNFMRLAARRGRLERIPLLFCGKVALDEIGTIAELADQKLISLPEHLPPTIRDLHALSAWFVLSNFFNRVNLPQVEADYAILLR